MRRWTEEEEAWLAERYASEHIGKLAVDFRERFGRDASEQALFQKAYAMGLAKRKRDVPDRAVRTVRWSCEPEMQAWMDAHDEGQSLELLSAAFAGRFGFPLSRGQINLWRASNGRQVRRSNGGGRHRLPIGYERDTGKGYVLVKVAEEATVAMSKDNWRAKHVLAWEREHGPLPEGYDVVFGDRDHRNCDPSNLVAVPHRLIGRLNSKDSPEWHDAESLRAAAAWCELHARIATAEASLPRACGVCGREFTPPPESRLDFRRNVQTCPECRKAGKRARGERKVSHIGTCAVCGREFAAHGKNQVRCEDCIRKKPKHSAKQQKGGS